MVIATHAEKTRTTTLDVATVGPRARSSAKSALRGMDYASGAAALSTRGKGTSRKNGPGECDGYLPTMMALHTELANAYPALPDAAYDWVDSVICDTDPTPQTAHFEDRHDRDYALWWNGSSRKAWRQVLGLSQSMSASFFAISMVLRMLAGASHLPMF